jgi:hypothetical protein
MNDNYSGTSISDLRAKNYDQNQNYQSYQGDQQFQNYDGNQQDNDNISVYSDFNSQQNMSTEQQNIPQNIPQNIQQNIPQNIPDRVQPQYVGLDPDFKQEYIRPEQNNKQRQQTQPSIFAKHSYYLQEVLLIIILYVLLSQPFAVKFFRQFIKFLVPTSDGQISMIGLASYGLILGLLFVFIKKYTLPLF